MANNKDIIVCGSCSKHDVCKFKEDFASAVDEIKESKFFNKSELGITCSLDCNYYISNISCKDNDWALSGGIINGK